MKSLVTWLRQLGHYLWGKRSELQEMSKADVLLAKVVLDIHRLRTCSEFIGVPLFALCQIHPLNRENSLQATEKRIAILQKHKNALLKKLTLSREILQEYLPSVSAIKVVRDDSGKFIAFEGNGRLAALHDVFSVTDNMTIEVEEYLFKDNTKIIRRMNRIRTLHNLL
ncbi:MAG: hypothetical protein KKD73_13300 [Proteobacteria bacterium]|nr:hypothetical protein [Pseudomonadota bacterium]MBU1639503.1 hypothetical protein [Pseudomonadota bacterium]